jgi:plasmid maintenance system antidote protein VapI
MKYALIRLAKYLHNHAHKIDLMITDRSQVSFDMIETLAFYAKVIISAAQMTSDYTRHRVHHERSHNRTATFR